MPFGSSVDPLESRVRLKSGQFAQILPIELDFHLGFAREHEQFG